jgi:hypothetical protein
LTNKFNVKDDKEMFDLLLIHPVLLFLFSDVNLYCYEERLPLVITRVVDERIPGVSVSDTHGEGRAIDISVNGWSDYDISKFVKKFNKKYSKKYGAFSYSDGKPRFAVYHDGTAMHIHLQIRRIP